jgi:hypothetical protein
MTEYWGGSAPKEVGAICDVEIRGAIVNLGVTMLALAGAVYTAKSFGLVLAQRRFSLRGLLVFTGVAAAMCAIIKYDVDRRSLLVDLGYSSPKAYYPITSSPVWLYVPVLVGVAAGIWTGVSALLYGVALATAAVLRRLGIRVESRKAIYEE